MHNVHLLQPEEIAAYAPLTFATLQPLLARLTEGGRMAAVGASPPPLTSALRA